MSATNLGETGILSLFLANVDMANVGDATGLRGSSTAGSWYISLHIADPGETGNQATNEAAYISYARVAVARSLAQWTIAVGGDSICVGDNDNAITFPACTGSSETITHVGIGSASSGAGNLFGYGTLTQALPVSSGVTPSFAAGTLDITLI